MVAAGDGATEAGGHVLAGDLATTPLPQVLRRLADGAATGGLHLIHPAGDSAAVFLRGGQICTVRLPGTAAPLGTRLVTAGRVSSEALAHAEDVRSTDGQHGRLEDVLVQLGHADQSDVDAVLREQRLSALDGLLRWTAGRWRFRINERADDASRPAHVEVLLAEAEERRLAWRAIEAVLPCPDTVPGPSAVGSTEAELAISSDAWALLCQVDSVRTVAQLAADCGFTLYEAGSLLVGLLSAGLLEVEDVPHVDSPVNGSVVARLLAAFAPRATGGAVEPGADDELLAGMSGALAALLRPVTDETLFAARPRVLLPPLSPAAVVAAHSPPPVSARPEAPRVPATEPAAISDESPDEWTLARDAFAELSAVARSIPDLLGDDRSSTGAIDPSPHPSGDPQPPDLAWAGKAAAAEAAVGDYPQREYGDNTDTAALLRELSSLGLEEGPAASPGVRPAAPRPVGDALAAKRKKGLFGR